MSYSIGRERSNRWDRCGVDTGQGIVEPNEFSIDLDRCHDLGVLLGNRRDGFEAATSLGGCGPVSVTGTV